MPASAPDLLTGIMLAVFRVNGRLLEKGDRMVAPLGLTSARWQVLGAVNLAGHPLTAPQIADAMGITRQGAQKQLNKLAEEGFFEVLPNPRHERSPLYALTPKAVGTLSQVMALHETWVARLAQELAPETGADALAAALDLLGRLHDRLAGPVPDHVAILQKGEAP